MKNCFSCGIVVADTVKFCPECGVALVASTDRQGIASVQVESEEESSKKRQKDWIIAGVLLIVALIMIIIALLVGRPGDEEIGREKGPYGTYTVLAGGRLNIGTLTFRGDLVIDETFGSYKEAEWEYENGIVTLIYESGSRDSYLYDAKTDTFEHTSMNIVCTKE